MNLICPKCKKQFKKSTIRIKSQFNNLEKMDVFWDEEGNQHFHYPNYNDEHYECSNGHLWNHIFYPPVCFCGWECPRVKP